MSISDSATRMADCRYPASMKSDMTDTGTNGPATATLRHVFDDAPAGHGGSGDLGRAIADELLERLAAVKIEPRTVVDLGCGDGHATRVLQGMYRRALVIGVDRAPGAVRARGWRPGRRPRAVRAALARLPLPDASVDLLYSNLLFRRQHEPQALFTELRRVLRPGGVLMFSTLGPDTLWELRAAWAAVDGRVQLPELTDMHDIGDALLAAGLRDPVMDVDRLRRDYPDLRALLRTARTLGAPGVAAGRPRGLTGRGTLERLRAAWPVSADGGSVPASWEVVFGHAWGASTPRAASGDAREFRVPIESVGRARRGPDGD